jgi:hypothetical protein
MSRLDGIQKWAELAAACRYCVAEMAKRCRVTPRHLERSVSFVNNLFDRVNISLDPDCGPGYWYQAPYPNPTIDLQVVATNNTFRGGWLFLEPTKASAGDWVFENNLFDKVVFAQDQYQPLDFDYNAYWPCDPATELYPGQIPHLTAPTPTRGGYIDGTIGNHEVQLAAQPGYQHGPLGEFYLPASGPLFGSGNRPAGEVGLFHYTTRVDQGKEGEEPAGHHVNIGVHYVAVDSSGKPKDSDVPTPDGIPDYVEDANGNGVWEANETDWTQTQTLTGTPDPLNTLYDDVDLDGDGMVGRIEKALHPANPQPLVPDNPLALTPVAIEGVDPRTLTFRINLDYSEASNASRLQLLTDGTATAAADLEAGSGACLLSWNTAFSAPGFHVLSARLSIKGAAKPDEGYFPVLEASGPVTACSVNNLLQFEPFYCQYTSAGAMVHALLPESRATYSVELQTPAGGHVIDVRII